MTDTTVNLPIASELSQPRPRKAPWVAGRFPAAVAGLGAGLAAYAGALGQAYSAPFRLSAEKEGLVLREGEAGRDPNW